MLLHGGGYADAVAGLVSALGLERPHLCGLSFGGGMAIAVHQPHPELARSLVPAGAYAGWKGSLPSEEIAARVGRCALPRTVVESMHAGIPGAEPVMLPGVGHAANLEAPDSFNSEVRRFLRTVG